MYRIKIGSNEVRVSATSLPPKVWLFGISIGCFIITNYDFV